LKAQKEQVFSGKKVAVFFTQGGEKPQAIDRTKALMPNSDIVGELSLPEPIKNKEASEKKIIEWCQTFRAL
jgi:hypothetical protein